MPFDATKPANNTALNSAEMRAQLTNLKSLIDACPTNATMADCVANNSAPPISVGLLATSASNPPTQVQVQAVINKLNELINALYRP